MTYSELETTEKNKPEYKIVSYVALRLDNTTLLPIGRKKTRYAVYKKKFPFPNKSIFLWENIRGDFRTEEEAEEFMKILTNK